MPFELKTFKDYIDAVREEIKIQSTDINTINRIKRDINMIYINEVAPVENWYWLRNTVNLTTSPAMFLGSSSVIANNNQVVLTENPAYSRQGWYFSTADFAEVYRIREHNPGSDTLILETPYMGVTNTAARYNLWTDVVPLPANLRETIEIGLETSAENLMAVGYQEFRQIQKLNPKASSRPVYYTTTNFKDPNEYEAISGLPAPLQRKSNGLIKTIKFAATLNDGEGVSRIQVGDRIKISDAGSDHYNGSFIVSNIATSAITNDTIVYTGTVNASQAFTSDGSVVVLKKNVESSEERYRALLVHPSLLATKSTLKVDGILHATAMTNDSDEPLIPLEDRSVMLYGALWKAWARERNESESARNFALFQNKLAAMKSKMEDSVEFPRLTVSTDYLRIKRRQY